MKKALLITTLILASSTSVAYADTYASVDANGNVTNIISCTASVCGAGGSWGGIAPDGNKLVLQSSGISGGLLTQQNQTVNYSQNTNTFTVTQTASPSTNAGAPVASITVAAPAAPIALVRTFVAPPQPVFTPQPIVTESQPIITQTETTTPVETATVDCTDIANSLNVECLTLGSSDPVPYNITKNPIPIDSGLTGTQLQQAITNTQNTINLMLNQNEYPQSVPQGIMNKLLGMRGLIFL